MRTENEVPLVPFGILHFAQPSLDSFLCSNLPPQAQYIAQEIMTRIKFIPAEYRTFFWIFWSVLGYFLRCTYVFFMENICFHAIYSNQAFPLFKLLPDPPHFPTLPTSCLFSLFKKTNKIETEKKTRNTHTYKKPLKLETILYKGKNGRNKNNNKSHKRQNVYKNITRVVLCWPSAPAMGHTLKCV